MARQRLRGLVASFPSRLDVRERLAQVYRVSGDLAQAGRWSYLSPERVETEQLAFKARYGDEPLRMMIALAWRQPEQEASTDLARRQLADLRISADGAAYLHAHPELQVTLTGHTDPTGPGPYNETLGLQRANAAAARLRAAGVGADQIVVQSEGKRSLITTVPSQYRLNRRVAFGYLSRPGPYRDPMRDEALADLRAKVGPPYPDITRFVPKPLAAATGTPGSGASTVATSQVELENWRWGSIPPKLRGEIDAWVRGYGPMLTAKISTAKELDDAQVKGYGIHPRPLVEAVVTDLLKDPTGFMEVAFGRPMSP